MTSDQTTAVEAPRPKSPPQPKKVPKAVKPSTNGKPSKMPKMHVRILTAMLKHGDVLTVDKIAALIKTDWPKTVRWAIGTVDPGVRDPGTLLGRKHVTQTRVGLDGKDELNYGITRAGEAALRKATA